MTWILGVFCRDPNQLSIFSGVKLSSSSFMVARITFLAYEVKDSLRVTHTHKTEEKTI